jgi:spore coat polysaccharide biosynthesis protein SpsF (cytidylyltransferase family)
MSPTATVLQARMGSTRLPGKVLARIDRWSVLEHCVRRLQQSGVPVIVATTTGSEDDAIEQAARTLRVEVFRGEEADVLARFIGAARAFGLSRVVRATADNPLVDSGAVTRTLAFQERVGADHVVECGLPVGTAVEAVTVDALERAAALADDPYDREHVTSLIRRDARFTALRAVAPGALRRPGLRLTVDTAEDLEFIRDVYGDLAATGDRIPDLVAAIAAADARIVRAMARKPISRGQKCATPVC